MALIAMATYCTPDNGRAALLKQTLDSLLKSVDFVRHRIIIIVNASTEESAADILEFQKALPFPDSLDSVIWLAENVGTARAINMAWQTRKEGEVCVKMDDDVVFGRCSNGWLDLLEEAINRESKIGILGLKRPDLLESANSADPNWRSQLVELAHKPGQANITVEVVQHVMGTCQAYNPLLLDRIGYLFQPGLYGFDDSLAGVRAKVAGFVSAFLCNVEIHHIDPGGNDYTQYKRDVAGLDMAEYHRLKAGYLDGSIPIWYGPNGEQKETLDRYTPGYGWSVPNYSTR